MPDISQGSVATHLWADGIFNDNPWKNFETQSTFGKV